MGEAKSRENLEVGLVFSFVINIWGSNSREQKREKYMGETSRTLKKKTDEHKMNFKMNNTLDATIRHRDIYDRNGKGMNQIILPPAMGK